MKPIINPNNAAALYTRLQSVFPSWETSFRIELRRPLDHQSNRLYDLWQGDKHWIIKEFLKPEEWTDAPARESRALIGLSPLDIAPQFVYYDPGNPPGQMPVVVYQFMEGVMWDRTPPNPVQLAELADLWVVMNGYSDAGLWYSRGYPELISPRLIGRFQQYLQTYQHWASANYPAGVRYAQMCTRAVASVQLEAVFADIAQRPAVLCFSRADPRFANVIQRPNGRLGMVDWEDSGLRDPALDLADLLTHPNQEDLISPDLWQAFLKPYLAARKSTDPGLEDRMHMVIPVLLVYRLLVLLQIGAEKAVMGQLDGWQVNGLSPNLRLQRYLAGITAWPARAIDDHLANFREFAFFPTE